MIDERKIKKELNSLLVKAKPNSIEERLLKGFREYINRQHVMSTREIRFAHRMRMVMAVAGVELAVEVEE